ncbi:MAG: AraC family transcriptional regulator [Bacteroidota bacterium]
MPKNIDGLLVQIGLFLSIMIAIAIGFKVKKVRANIWLTAFFLVTIVVFIVKVFYTTGDIVNYPHWFKVNYPAGLLRPVFLYLYVLFLLERTTRFNWKLVLHFIPFFMLVGFLTPFFIQESNYKLAVLNGEIVNKLGLIPSWYIYFQFTYSFIYLLMTYQIFKRYMLAIPKTNKAQRILVKWIRLFIFVSFAYLIIAFIIRMFGLAGDFNQYVYELFSIILIVFCIILMIVSPFDQIQSALKVPYEKSWLSQSDIISYSKKIEELMVDRQLFIQQDLKLRDIAKLIELPEYLVSQIVNKSKGLTFREYINSFRIEKAKVMLNNAHEKYTIEGIAKEVGFVSRTAFYNAFKKNTSLTPTAFIKKNKLKK